MCVILLSHFYCNYYIKRNFLNDLIWVFNRSEKGKKVGNSFKKTSKGSPVCICSFHSKSIVCISISCVKKP